MRKFVLAGLVLLSLAAIAVAPMFRCVVEGVMIDTPFGPRAVEELDVGDVVWARDARGELSTGTVSEIRRGYTLQHLRFRLDNGAELAVTSSHPIFVDGAWVEAGQLVRGVELESRTGMLGLTRVDSVLAWSAVYDVSVAPHENFYANGVLVHNKSPNPSPSQAFSDSRTVISSLQTYAASNCGFFPRDLTSATRGDGTPIGIPDYPDEAPEFLGADLARSSPYWKSTYVRTYQAFGRPPSVPPECDPDSALAYCYSSTPVIPFSVGWADSFPWLADILGFHNRSFVATSDGAIYMDTEGRELTCVDGKPPDYARPAE